MDIEEIENNPRYALTLPEAPHRIYVISDYTGEEVTDFEFWLRERFGNRANLNLFTMQSFYVTVEHISDDEETIMFLTWRGGYETGSKEDFLHHS